MKKSRKLAWVVLGVVGLLTVALNAESIWMIVTAREVARWQWPDGSVYAVVRGYQWLDGAVLKGTMYWPDGHKCGELRGGTGMRRIRLKYWNQNGEAITQPQFLDLYDKVCGQQSGSPVSEVRIAP